jgi:hypothetical protein
MVSDKLSMRNRTSDFKIYVLIDHLLYYPKMKMSWYGKIHTYRRRRSRGCPTRSRGTTGPHPSTPPTSAPLTSPAPTLGCEQETSIRCVRTGVKESALVGLLVAQRTVTPCITLRRRREKKRYRDGNVVVVACVCE